jgi:hypothetical protein
MSSRKIWPPIAWVAMTRNDSSSLTRSLLHPAMPQHDFSLFAAWF